MFYFSYICLTMSQIDVNLNKIMNLIRFNANLSRYVDIGELVRQSPDYILEKYNHWISFNPVIDEPIYTPDDCEQLIHQYSKIWGRFPTQKVTRHLFYLQQTNSMKLLNMVEKFEVYFGPIELISSEEKNGLHFILERDFVSKVVEYNEEALTIILRDLKLKKLVNN